MTDTTRDLIQRLANALHDAAEDVGFWGSYASGYFQEKHDLPGNIAKIHAQAEEARAYLDQPEPEGVEDRIFKLEADLERERLRLAACGVVALADTPESAAKARDMSPEYHSSSLNDVIRQIDALMELRAYLSQPEPEEPTEEELEEFALKHGGGYFNCDCQAEADILTRKHVSNYRAVLARWGRPTTTTQEDN